MRGDVSVSVNVPLKSLLAFIFLNSGCFSGMKTSPLFFLSSGFEDCVAAGAEVTENTNLNIS